MAAAERGLILVDTKYEFGKLADGTIVLIDEIHTHRTVPAISTRKDMKSDRLQAKHSANLS
jgi:phosphoribosylaminoimidazole-succinocarboxamide synthase